MKGFTSGGGAGNTGRIVAGVGGAPRAFTLPRNGGTLSPWTAGTSRTVAAVERVARRGPDRPLTSNDLEYVYVGEVVRRRQ